MCANLTFARFLCDRATSFRPDAGHAGLDQIFHHGAISIELALKSFLAGTGIGDDWLRDHVGHDLDTALQLATDRGLVAPAETRRIVGLVHPYFMEGGFHHVRRSWPAELVPALLDVIDGLLCEARKRSAG